MRKSRWDYGRVKVREKLVSVINRGRKTEQGMGALKTLVGKSYQFHSEKLDLQVEKAGPS